MRTGADCSYLMLRSTYREEIATDNLDLEIDIQSPIRCVAAPKTHTQAHRSRRHWKLVFGASHADDSRNFGQAPDCLISDRCSKRIHDWLSVLCQCNQDYESKQSYPH